jgi:hypothetical protein
MAGNIRAASLERFTRIVEAVVPAKRQPVLEALSLLTAAVRSLEKES